MIEDPRALRVRDAFREKFGRPPEILVRAPGRVVLLGAHVDYQEARVLPAAIHSAVFLAAARRDDGRLRLAALDLGATAELELAALPPPVPERHPWNSGFADYPAGVVRELAAAGCGVEGLDAAYGGDLPQGAGVSSSAAVEVAFLLAFRELYGLDLDAVAVAGIARRTENHYLGVQSGAMDQLACLEGRAGHAVLVDCRTFGTTALPLGAGLGFLVFDSGVRRRLVDSGFNDRRSECRLAIAILKRFLPCLEVLRDLDAATLADLERHLPAPLDRRVRHAVEEMARVEEGAAALRRGDVGRLGELMRRSQESSRDLYEVSLPELDLLCEAAWRAPGCLGARLMGGGFGGAVAALVEADAAAGVAEAVAATFAKGFGRRPPVFATSPAAGAQILARG